MQRLTTLSVTYVQGKTSFQTVWHGLQSFQQTLTPRTVRHISTPLATVMYRTVSLSNRTPKSHVGVRCELASSRNQYYHKAIAIDIHWYAPGWCKL